MNLNIVSVYCMNLGMYCTAIQNKSPVDLREQLSLYETLYMIKVLNVCDIKICETAIYLVFKTNPCVLCVNRYYSVYTA